MNAFSKHGIEHLSASRINKWITQPALCLLEIAGINDRAGPAAWRGTAVDKAITKAAFDRDTPIDQLVGFACEVFDHEHSQSDDPPNQEKLEKERKSVSAYMETGVAWIRGMEQPIDAQGKVSVEIDQIPIPFIGYYDLLMKDQVRDIKTTASAPTALSQAHGRQLAVYAKGTKKEPWVDYVTKKEVRSFKVDNVAFYERQLMLAAQSLERVLSHSDDIYECCQLVYPDLDHWMWSDMMKSVAKDVWKMEG